MLIKDFFAALQHGKELTNAATWKNRTIAANSLFALLTALVGIGAALGYRLDVDSDTLQALAGGIAALFGFVNAVMHLATSARVGLPGGGQPGESTSYMDIGNSGSDQP
jgi:hypothetical protein